MTGTGTICSFRLFTPYCVDYIRRLISGEDLWDIIEYDGSYKEGEKDLVAQGNLFLCPSFFWVLVSALVSVVASPFSL